MLKMKTFGFTFSSILTTVTLVLIALYLIYIYKEVKLFENEIVALRSDVDKLKKGVPGGGGSPSVPGGGAVSPGPPAVVTVAHTCNQDEDDDDSVESDDIETIINKIDAIDETRHPTPVPTPTVKPSSLIDRNLDVLESMTDGALEQAIDPTMTSEQLSKFTYTQLRGYLKTLHIVPKGNKEAIVQKIKSLDTSAPETVVPTLASDE